METKIDKQGIKVSQPDGSWKVIGPAPAWWVAENALKEKQAAEKKAKTAAANKGSSKSKRAQSEAVDNSPVAARADVAGEASAPSEDTAQAALQFVLSKFKGRKGDDLDLSRVDGNLPSALEREIVELTIKRYEGAAFEHVDGDVPTRCGITRYDYEYFASHGYPLTESQTESVLLKLDKALKPQEFIAFAKDVIATKYVSNPGYDVLPAGLQLNMMDLALCKSEKSAKCVLHKALLMRMPEGATLDGFTLKDLTFTPLPFGKKPKDEHEKKLQAYYADKSLSADLITQVVEHFQTKESAATFINTFLDVRAEYHKADAASKDGRKTWLKGWLNRSESLRPEGVVANVPEHYKAMQERAHAFYAQELDKPAVMPSALRLAEVTKGLPKGLEFSGQNSVEYSDMVVAVKKTANGYESRLYTHSQMDKLAEDKTKDDGYRYITCVKDGKLQPISSESEKGLLIKAVCAHAKTLRAKLYADMKEQPELKGKPIAVLGQDISHYTLGVEGASAKGVNETVFACVKSIIGANMAAETGALPYILQEDPQLAGFISYGIANNALPAYENNYNMGSRGRAADAIPQVISKEYKLAVGGNAPPIYTRTLSYHFDGVPAYDEKNREVKGLFVQVGDKASDLASKIVQLTPHYGISGSLRKFGGEAFGYYSNNPRGIHRTSDEAVLVESLNSGHPGDAARLTDITFVYRDTATGMAAFGLAAQEAGVDLSASCPALLMASSRISNIGNYNKLIARHEQHAEQEKLLAAANIAPEVVEKAMKASTEGMLDARQVMPVPASPIFKMPEVAGIFPDDNVAPKKSSPQMHADARKPSADEYQPLDLGAVAASLGKETESVKTPEVDEKTKGLWSRIKSALPKFALFSKKQHYERGDKAVLIGDAQAVLKAGKYYQDRIDNDFGRNMEKGLNKFQAEFAEHLGDHKFAFKKNVLDRNAALALKVYAEKGCNMDEAAKAVAVLIESGQVETMLAQMDAQPVDKRNAQQVKADMAAYSGAHEDAGLESKQASTAPHKQSNGRQGSHAV